MKVLLLLLALFGLALSQNQHVETTSVTLGEEITADGEHILVSIDHIEDEISVDGKILAERHVHVGLLFDVVETDKVLVNGVPAPLGYSELKVEASLFEIDEAGQPSPFDQIVSIKVRIFVGQRTIQAEDGSFLSGIYIQERVVGIQEKEVWQATVKEQSFIVRKDGTIQALEIVEVEVLQGEKPEDLPHGHGHGHGHGHKGQQQQGDQKEEQQEFLEGGYDQQHEQPETPEVHPPHSHTKCKLRKYWHKFVDWFSNLPFYLRLLFSFAFGLVFGFIGIAFIKCLCCTLCRSSKKSKEENYKKNIHLYSLEYTAVPIDEKQAEKKEAAQTA